MSADCRCNAYSIVIAEKDKEFRNTCECADIVLADGNPDSRYLFSAAWSVVR
jgi:hypothetical protein